jgi:hypothetical protein
MAEEGVVPRARRRLGVWAVAGIAAAIAALGGVACDHLPGHHDTSPPADPRIVRKLCSSDLGGPKASLQIWRDDADRITVYELQPDPDAHAKASAALYDSRGREQLRLPPVEDPGSPQALDVQRRREMVFEDSKRREEIACRLDGGAQRAP